VCVCVCVSVSVSDCVCWVGGWETGSVEIGFVVMMVCFAALYVHHLCLVCTCIKTLYCINGILYCMSSLFNNTTRV